MCKCHVVFEYDKCKFYYIIFKSRDVKTLYIHTFYVYAYDTHYYAYKEYNNKCISIIDKSIRSSDILVFDKN